MAEGGAGVVASSARISRLSSTPLEAAGAAGSVFLPLDVEDPSGRRAGRAAVLAPAQVTPATVSARPYPQVNWELFGLFPEASRSGDEILLLLINIIIYLFKSSSFNAQSHGYSDAYHMIIPELGRIDRSHAAARPLP